MQYEDRQGVTFVEKTSELYSTIVPRAAGLFRPVARVSAMKNS